MASMEKRLENSPSFVSSLKDALISRQGLAEREHLHSSTKPVEMKDPRGEDERPCVLVTNDDGIDAPGLRALVEALVNSGCCNVYVCAPDSNKSGVGHSITVQQTLVVSSISIKGAVAYEMSGTPADCVSLSLSGVLFPQKKPSLVLSGINKGSNCGYHIFYSGTVAGAHEAFICGIPSISLSLQWRQGESFVRDFNVAAAICLPLIQGALQDIDRGVFPRGFFLNINIPVNPSQHKGLKVTRQGTSRLMAKWCRVSSQRGFSRASVCKENAVGVRLAQLGVAASVVGAARRLNSPLKNIEVESIAEPKNGHQPSDSQEKLYFRNELEETEVGDMDSDHDYGALHEGHVTITPLGSLPPLEPESFSGVAEWIAAYVDFTVRPV